MFGKKKKEELSVHSPYRSFSGTELQMKSSPQNLSTKLQKGCPFDGYREIVDPPSGFKGYEIVNEDKENLAAILKLLSGGASDTEGICFDGKYEFADSLEEAGFLTADLEQEYDLEGIVNELNRVAAKNGYGIKLSVENVKSRDSEKAKSARERFKYLPMYDLNLCAEIISEQGYELFQLFLDCGGLNMAVLPKEKMGEVGKYTE